MTSEPSLNQRERQRLKTRGQILDAALQVFGEKGFDAASVREIAAKVGVNHALIRHHFQNKDELWKEAVRFLFERMQAELSMEPEAEADLDDFERLKGRIRRYVAYCARHPEHSRIMVQQSIHGSERFTWMVKDFIAPQHRAGSRHLRKHIEGGLWPEVNEISLTYILVAAAQMPFVLSQEIREIYGVEPTEAEWVDRHADAIISLFFNHCVNQRAKRDAKHEPHPSRAE